MQNCLVCDEELKEVVCSGIIKGMSVTFCDVHAELCENCETIKCDIIR